jgi:hypothetical protein
MYDSSNMSKKTNPTLVQTSFDLMLEWVEAKINEKVGDLPFDPDRLSTTEILWNLKHAHDAEVSEIKYSFDTLQAQIDDLRDAIYRLQD